MAKNTCAGLKGKEIFMALGIPETTYYRYLKDSDYPFHAPLADQKAWVDSQREKAGKGGAPKPAKGKGKDDKKEGPEYGTREYYELERIKFQAHNERMKAQAEVDRILEAGQTIMRRKIGAVMEGMTEVIQQGLCGTCSEKLVERWQFVKAQLDAELEGGSK